MIVLKFCFTGITICYYVLYLCRQYNCLNLSVTFAFFFKFFYLKTQKCLRTTKACHQDFLTWDQEFMQKWNYIKTAFYTKKYENVHGFCWKRKALTRIIIKLLKWCKLHNFFTINIPLVKNQHILTQCWVGQYKYFEVVQQWYDGGNEQFAL